MEVEIRSCGPEDAAALALVGGATFLEAYAGRLPGADILAHCATKHTQSVYAAWLADPACGLWIAQARDGGAPVGYAVSAPSGLEAAQAGDLELHRLYLLHRFQGFGVGAGLMAAAIGHAKEAGAGRLLLGVWSDNAAALGFYKRQGFVAVGARRFQVGGNVYDDLVLALDLTPARA